MPDWLKTQVLFDNDGQACTFKRSRTHVWVKDKEVVKADYTNREECDVMRADGWTLRTVWVLKEISL